MACFVCDEKPSNADTKADADNENSDCPRCGPFVILNWKNGQCVLKHMGAHILHDGKVDSSIKLCGLCLQPAPMCQFYLRKARGTAGSISIDRKKSSCVNMIQFNYATASTSSEASCNATAGHSSTTCTMGSGQGKDKPSFKSLVQ